jgi:hypothetical protein
MKIFCICILQSFSFKLCIFSHLYFFLVFQVVVIVVRTRSWRRKKKTYVMVSSLWRGGEDFVHYGWQHSNGDVMTEKGYRRSISYFEIASNLGRFLQFSGNFRCAKGLYMPPPQQRSKNCFQNMKLKTYVIDKMFIVHRG